MRTKKDDDLSKSQLLELYSIAVDEYRFTVRLNWNRTRYYLVLNAAILAAGAGLLRSQPSLGGFLLLGGFFIAGILTSLLGAQATEKGHRYYRRANYKKTLLEDQLGILKPVSGLSDDKATLAIATTRGMSESRKILHDTDEYFERPLRKESIIFRLVWLLRIFAALNFVGLLLTGYLIYSNF